MGGNRYANSGLTVANGVIGKKTTNEACVCVSNKTADHLCPLSLAK